MKSKIDKKVERICRKFQKKMQLIVNNSDIESISITAGNGPKVTIASKEDKIANEIVNRQP